MQLIDAHKLNYELVASWTVELGDLDQALHLWRYTGGFATIDNAKKKLAQNKVSLNIFNLKECVVSSIDVPLSSQKWTAHQMRTIHVRFEFISCLHNCAYQFVVIILGWIGKHKYVSIISQSKQPIQHNLNFTENCNQ